MKRRSVTHSSLSGLSALTAVGLAALAARLDDSELGEQQLSSDEQQRLILARTLLHQPDWIVMDDATAQLDDAAEREVYELLSARLRHAAVISITNRPDVAALHQHRCLLAPDASGGMTLRPEIPGARAGVAGGESGEHAA